MQTHKQALYGARIALAMMTVVLSLGFLYRVPPLLAQDACPADLPTRLSVGTQGRVRSDGPNDMHAEPSLAASYVGEVQALGMFDIAEGPVCADDAVWWKVNFFGLIGWMQEGRDGVYWLNPHTATDPTTGSDSSSTSVPLSGQSSEMQDTDVFYETFWEQTFDDPTTWAQSGSPALMGDIQENGYVMQATRISPAYLPDDFTLVEDITPFSSLEKYLISFDVQNLTPDFQSQCGMLVINPGALEEIRVRLCHGVLVMMPVAFEFGSMPLDDTGALFGLREIPFDPLDGDAHYVVLSGDGENLHLYIDGQSGIEFPYPYPLKSFLLVHVDPNLGGSETQSNALILFDNVTLSEPYTCQLIVTVTLKEVVIEPLNSTLSAESITPSFRYGMNYALDEYVNQKEKITGPIPWTIGYKATLKVGDRISGFPPLTQGVNCTAVLKEAFFGVSEGDGPLSSKIVSIDENNLSMFPVETSAEIVSADSSHVYRLTYVVDVMLNQGTLLDTPDPDFSTVQIEHNPPK